VFRLALVELIEVLSFAPFIEVICLLCSFSEYLGANAIEVFEKNSLLAPTAAVGVVVYLDGLVSILF
jgi:hypothetical protein